MATTSYLAPFQQLASACAHLLYTGRRKSRREARKVYIVALLEEGEGGLPIHKEYSMRQYIGAVIIKRNTFAFCKVILL
jgi:hypothetical protein